ncbi:hypothetical protein [Edaphobacter aggregans]|uniref:hypothetical protein n=1 Tax=Edaphobacter aggregans TaxID=570835 RepID=UPI00163A9DC0|nr:hypothetical protein [Edaphobacter aggregans]
MKLAIDKLDDMFAQEPSLVRIERRCREKIIGHRVYVGFKGGEAKHESGVDERNRTV